jgi:hypothetical protein
MTSGSSMMLLSATTVAEAAPIWGREDDAPADMPIRAVAVVPTATVMSRASSGDPSPAITSGASGEVALDVATSLGVGSPLI